MAQVPKTIWCPPKDFPWPPSFSFVPQTSTAVDVTSQFAELWNQIETQAARQTDQVIPKSAFGRAKVDCTVTKAFKSPSPLKPSRAGEIVPTFHGVSFKHAMYFKQARRLQSYLRQVKKASDSHTSMRAFQQWKSIRTASGFGCAFPTWWTNCDIRTPHAPAQIAQAIFDTMLLALRQLEKQLRNSSRQYARSRRAADPMLIFADLKQGNAPGVELFVEPLQARVVECRSEDQSLILDRAQAWVDDTPILCDGRPLPIIHADSDQVWLDPMPDIPLQAQLVQVKCTGLTQDILEAFEQAWSDRWNKHQAVPESQWNDILQFARDHLPRNTFTWDSLTAETLAQCIRLKKNKTS